ncbi:hypothetical protein AMEX_G22898 [Astyanax mexicanus]|uniref:Ig-like domain-containing protein n=1 Tax=Astyanax mexicanus TaxID=7994 RepID=A0A8T2L6L0_ASTMX|nr:hypothetical protein AMEX_G22898 [Astyanax mexicanus]
MKRIFYYFFFFYWMSTLVFSIVFPLNTNQDVEVECNQSIVLQCTIISPEPVTVVDMHWMKPNAERITNRSCTLTSESLTCTITHASPGDAGNYICVLQASNGHGNNKTTVTVRDCVKSAPSDPLYCIFITNHSDGEVHWFCGEKNVTQASGKKQVKKTHEYFITSSLQDPGCDVDYNCSLWIPTLNTYVSSQCVQRNSSTNHKLPWIVLLLCFTFTKYKVY